MTCDPSTLEVKSGGSRVQGQPASKLEVPLGFVKPCYNQQTSLQCRWCIQTFRQGTGVILYSVLYWLSVLFTKEWREALVGRKGWGFAVSGLPIGVSCWLPLVVLSTGDCLADGVTQWANCRWFHQRAVEYSVQSLGAGPAGLKAPAAELSLSSDLHMCPKVCMHVSCARVHIQPRK